MSTKITVRMDDKLHDKLQDECKRFGYKSLNAYVCKILKERTLFEISYGNEVASIIHQIRICAGDLRNSERRRLLCQSYDSLMTEIERLRSCVESLNMQKEMEI